MGILKDLVAMLHNITNMVRIVALVFIISVGLLAAFGYFAVQSATEQLGARAERLGEKAIEARRIEARNNRLAKEGWGDETAGDWHEESDRGVDD